MLSAYNHQRTNNVNSTPDSPFKLLCTIMSPQIALGRSRMEDEAYCFGLNRLRLPSAFGTGLNSVILGALKRPMPVIGKNTTGIDVLFHNGTFPGSMSSAFLIPSSESAVVVFSNATPLMDATDFIGQGIISLLFGEQPPSNIVKLSEEARVVAVSSYIRLAAQLEKGKTAKPPQYPLEAYEEGSYWNAAHNIALNIKVRSEGGLRLTVQNLPLTHYTLLPYDGNTFYWPVDRDEELKKAMYPILSLARHKIAFSASGGRKEGIDTMIWHHDPVGKREEIFRKRTRLTQQSIEKFKL